MCSVRLHVSSKTSSHVITRSRPGIAPARQLSSDICLLRHRLHRCGHREAVLFDARSEPGAAPRLLAYDISRVAGGTGVATDVPSAT